MGPIVGHLNFLFIPLKVTSPITEPALHAKREPPIASGAPSVAATSGDVAALEGMDKEALSAIDSAGQVNIFFPRKKS